MKVLVRAVAVDVNGVEQAIVLEAPAYSVSRLNDGSVKGTCAAGQFSFMPQGEFQPFSNKVPPARGMER